MKILGISAFYHDSAAALIEDGEIVAAAQEERFTRVKHDPRFPENAIKYCLAEGKISLDDLDAIVFYDKPHLKFKRLVRTLTGFAPKKGFQMFIKAMPIWIFGKLWAKKSLNKHLRNIDANYNGKGELLFPEHHLSHGASAYYPSPFNDAAILTIDGVGEWATASIYHGKGNEIKKLRELRFPHSLGLLYSAFTYFLGFRVNSGEYKLMGLAPYGNPDSKETKQYVKTIKEKLITIQEDGSIWLNHKYFRFAHANTMIYEEAWNSLFGFERRNAESDIEQKHCNLGLAIQQVTEEIVLLMAKEAQRLTGSDNLCMAGGVALNCVSNGKLIKEGIFKNVFIQPASGDAGGALGAAYAGHYIFFKKERNVDPKRRDALHGSYLGPQFSAIEIEAVAAKYGAVYTKYERPEMLFDKVADYIAEGNAVGWFQGRMEFGPRALGNRSILGDARNPEMQKKLNLKIKYRESFRPFAPSVLEEQSTNYFDIQNTSPYMLEVQPVAKGIRNSLPKQYHDMPLNDKLYHLRSEIPAVTHVDFSARIQTVSKDTNDRYWGLINAFGQKTGTYLIVNTSFNVRGEPIVCNPEDAYRCLMRTEMDYLVVGDYVFAKTEQPEWKEAKDDWQKEFVLD